MFLIGLGDALGVDWASLIHESRKTTTKDLSADTTAKQRWQPHRILLEVGISIEMAGEQFTLDLLNNANQKLKEELNADAVASSTVVAEGSDETAAKNEGESLKSEINIKKEVFEMEIDDEYNNANGGDDNMIEKIKTEKSEVIPTPQSNDTTKNIQNVLSHPVACVQVAMKRQIQQRKYLISKAAGPCCRALSARRDLMLRRQLCELPKKNNVSVKANPELSYMAIHLFKKALENV